MLQLCRRSLEKDKRISITPGETYSTNIPITKGWGHSSVFPEKNTNLSCSANELLRVVDRVVWLSVWDPTDPTGVWGLPPVPPLPYQSQASSPDRSWNMAPILAYWDIRGVSFPSCKPYSCYLFFQPQCCSMQGSERNKFGAISARVQHIYLTDCTRF